MKRPTAPRVPNGIRVCRRTACAIGAAALLAPLLLTPMTDDEAPEQRLQYAFSDAAHDFHVPRSVLMGVSYVQTRWDAHPGSPSVAGGYGPMHLVDTSQFPATAPSPSGQGGGALRPSAGAAGAPAAAPEGVLAGRSVKPADLQRAAKLTGAPAGRLRTDAEANVRGGAALLAATQRQLGKPLSDNPADWWEAVERFPGTPDITSAATYANDVFAVIRKGAHRTTAEGQDVSLPANPGVRAHTVRTEKPRHAKGTECPAEVSCDWLAAPYEEIDDEGNYGNHDLADRPRDQKIQYIVIHDTEAKLSSMFQTVQDPTEASWHYSIRSSDGHITQHVQTKDEAWHSGNQYVNARSIGIEHEGFLRQPGTWFTEQMYRSSARLVRYLAKKYEIPLDRQHIFGHDNVPSPTGDSIPDMHDDPGPFWDWRHYFDLLGAPLKPTAGPDSDIVTILPDYATHTPKFTGCRSAGAPCAKHGSSAVRLYTRPDEKAPLIQDPGRHPDGGASTMDVDDLGSRASAGQTFAVAERRGDWTAIWYQGRKAWLENPKKDPTAVGAVGKMVTPKEGVDEIPVFGRALPEEEAYPEGVEEEPEAPLPYHFRAGQRYVAQGTIDSSFVPRSSFVDTPEPVVRGNETYYQIQFDNRIAYVRSSDVDVVGAPVTAGPSAGTSAQTPTETQDRSSDQ
ncbi:N-acetylmuramoyl-L-alanine amidase [Streptomyces sp. H49]|uniref:N-acetylmuramoyl-L-alanine amidase n=1 Tax=Streptomyces sp. H49 TaxID=3444117 RepID=UPI003F4AE599